MQYVVCCHNEPKLVVTLSFTSVLSLKKTHLVSPWFSHQSRGINLVLLWMLLRVRQPHPFPHPNTIGQSEHWYEVITQTGIHGYALHNEKKLWWEQGSLVGTPRIYFINLFWLNFTLMLRGDLQGKKTSNFYHPYICISVFCVQHTKWLFKGETFSYI